MQLLKMMDEIIEKRLKGHSPNKNHPLLERHLSESDFINRKNAAKAHGTTILALKYNKGVIVAADRRCTAGDMIFSDSEIKIEEIGALSCLAGAGWVCDIQWLVDVLMEEFIPSFERFWDAEIFVDGQARLLKYVMRNVFLLAWPILAGWNPFKETGEIFLFEPGGAKFEFDDYATCGSGESGAKGILEKEWSKNCSEARGIRIAVEALIAASETDRNTSNSSIRAPLIKVISSEKITDVPAEKAYEIAWGINVKKEVRKGTKDGVGTFIIKTVLKLGDEEKKETEEK